jgi:hypothetical protein
VLSSPTVDEEQYRFKGGRRIGAMVSGSSDASSMMSSTVTDDQSPPSASSTESVWSDGMSGHAGDGSVPFSSDLGPLAMTGPAAAGVGSVSSVVDPAVSASSGSVSSTSSGSSLVASGSVSVPVGVGSVYSGSAPSVSVECSSPGFAKNERIGVVSVAKPQAISAREDSQAWFFGWVRASVQDDEELLAKLDVIEERTRRAKLDALSPDRSKEMLQLREKLASMDVERGQALATAWLIVQDEECL